MVVSDAALVLRDDHGFDFGELVVPKSPYVTFSNEYLTGTALVVFPPYAIGGSADPRPLSTSSF